MCLYIQSQRLIPEKPTATAVRSSSRRSGKNSLRAVRASQKITRGRRDVILHCGGCLYGRSSICGGGKEARLFDPGCLALSEGVVDIWRQSAPPQDPNIHFHQVPFSGLGVDPRVASGWTDLYEARAAFGPCFGAARRPQCQSSRTRPRLRHPRRPSRHWQLCGGSA